MKKFIAGIFAVVFLGSAAYAGVSGINSNGRISGVPSYQVQCTSGRTVIIYKKNGTWYTGGSGHMGHRYDSWSTNDVAEYVCK